LLFGVADHLNQAGVVRFLGNRLDCGPLCAARERNRYLSLTEHASDELEQR
jgi:hypothetical protein